MTLLVLHERDAAKAKLDLSGEGVVMIAEHYQLLSHYLH